MGNHVHRLCVRRCRKVLDERCERNYGASERWQPLSPPLYRVSMVMPLFHSCGGKRNCEAESSHLSSTLKSLLSRNFSTGPACSGTLQL